jgi:hypothetical protein
MPKMCRDWLRMKHSMLNSNFHAYLAGRKRCCSACWNVRFFCFEDFAESKADFMTKKHGVSERSARVHPGTEVVFNLVSTAIVPNSDRQNESHALH